MEQYLLQNLTFSYPGASHPALDRLELSVSSGEFLVLCGPSGCGKSTLLRHLKTTLTPAGSRSGQILFDGVPLEQVPLREQASGIGFVLQSPENQVVTDKVFHELAFGLESLGADQATIRRRVAEIAGFFGIEQWFYKDVSQLSGGQKQLLSLASIMVMQPRVLVLDEPTAQLDPIAASDFLALLGRINRELGTTVILSEHRLEEALPYATRLVVLEQGRITADGAPRQVGLQLKSQGMFLAMPAAMRIWAAVDTALPCPLTVREGSAFLTARAEQIPLKPLAPEPSMPHGAAPLLDARDLWFRYEQTGPDVVRGLTLQLHPGELYALLGGNGTGKTTTLRLLSGLRKPLRGTVQCHVPIAALPQDPKALFVRDTLREDLLEVHPEQEQLQEVLALCGLTHLLDRHPYDLSGGEQQRAALAKVLLTKPRILLLDEPTKGFDAEFKQTFAAILRTLTQAGAAILMVSHDVDFCARYAHRCGLFFDGAIAAQGTAREFFSGNSFYTTSANRMVRHLEPQAVTCQDVIQVLGGRPEPEPHSPPVPEVLLPASPKVPQPLPLWRKLLAGLCAAVALVIFFAAAGNTSLLGLVGAWGVTAAGWKRLALYGLLVLALAGLTAAITRRGPVPPEPPRKNPLGLRTILASGLILLTIPLTILAGSFWLQGISYNVIALLVLVQCMAPFFLIFEGRKPQARELVTIAVLCAIGVAGRSAFFMLPQFKPTLALTIVAGVALGAESGFLVGSVTMLASNMLFSQGPWTPWQMFAMGIIGFLSGILFRRGRLGRSRWILAVFGGLSAIVVYGGIMNFSSAVTFSPATLSWQTLLPYYLSGLPMDLVHAAATVLFLLLAGMPILEKLDRIREKYQLM